MKRELTVRQAYEIGQHDQDAVAIYAEDDPILPTGGTPPVVDLLKKRRMEPRH